MSSRQLEGGGTGVFIGSGQRHRLVPWPGAKFCSIAPGQGTNRCLRPELQAAATFHHHRNRLLPSTGAYSAAIIWYRVVVQTGAYADTLKPVGTTIRCQLSSIRLVQGQRYQLLLQPVLNSSWYLWAGSMARFLVVSTFHLARSSDTLESIGPPPYGYPWRKGPPSRHVPFTVPCQGAQSNFLERRWVMEKSEIFFSFKEHNIYADAHLRECIRPYMYLVHLAVNGITLKKWYRLFPNNARKIQGNLQLWSSSLQ